MPSICKIENCKTQANYGLEKNKPLFCAKHKKNNMYDVKQKICEYKNCNKRAIYGLEKNGEKILCSTHKTKNMFNLINKICKYLDCKKRALFGINKAKYCSKHKDETMENLNSKKCEYKECKIQPSYGLEKNKPLFCVKHKKEDMKIVTSKICEYKNCDKIANFGLISGKSLLCIDHKTKYMFCSYYKQCSKCNLPYKPYHDSNYCSFCNPDKENKIRKEIVIKKLLQDNNYNFIHDNQFPNDCSDKYRPDFLFDCSTYYIILEVDEFCHKYKQECDLIRMNNITMSLGLPTLFIRYNPDNKTINEKERHKILLKVLNESLNYEFLENMDPIYLFY